MEKLEREMRSIWYFIGLLFVVMGGLILISGIYHLVSPVQVKTVLYQIHPNIWWGGLMLIVGVIFLFSHKSKSDNKKSE